MRVTPCLWLGHSCLSRLGEKRPCKVSKALVQIISNLTQSGNVGELIARHHTEAQIAAKKAKAAGRDLEEIEAREPHHTEVRVLGFLPMSRRSCTDYEISNRLRSPPRKRKQLAVTLRRSRHVSHIIPRRRSQQRRQRLPDAILKIVKLITLRLRSQQRRQRQLAEISRTVRPSLWSLRNERLTIRQ